MGFHSSKEIFLPSLISKTFRKIVLLGISQMKYTIIHWFIHTSFLIFVVFITTFWSISLRPSFYLNFSDEMFLLLYIDSFTPVSSSLLSLSQHFSLFTLRPSFYLNFSDEMFLLLYIDSFPPVSSPLLSSSQHFGPFPWGLLSIWISQMRCSYYYTLIHSHQFPHPCYIYHNILVPLPWDLLSLWISQVRYCYYLTLNHSHQFPHFCYLYHNNLIPLPWGFFSVWISQMRCSYHYTLNHSNHFPHLCYIFCNILVQISSKNFSEIRCWYYYILIFSISSFLLNLLQHLGPSSFFPCEFLWWDLITIIHCFMHTSFLYLCCQ